MDWCNKNEFGKIILEEWTGLDENRQPIDINNFTQGSGKKVIWRCHNCKNEWAAVINNRISYRSGCRKCNPGGYSIPIKTSLLDWCNEHSERGERLKSEFTGKCLDSKTYSLDNISYQSNKRFIWKCKYNHTWDISVQKRVACGSNCPYCSNQRVLKGANDLETWCKNNNKQYLIDEFAGKDEEHNIISINSLAKSSHKRVKWRHITNEGETHEWYATVADRTYKNSGCQYVTELI